MGEGAKRWRMGWKELGEVRRGSRRGGEGAMGWESGGGARRGLEE